MRLLSIVLLILLLAAALHAQEESIVFYNGFETPGDMYVWDWGFAETPQTVADIGYTPGTAALDVKYDTSGIDPSWLDIGTFFGYSSNVGVSMQDIFPDSVYFKLRAPDGISENDSLIIWLYDSNNSTWDNANYFELENYAVLEDSNWHQFSLNLWDFQPYLNDMNIDDFVAVSIETPVANLPKRLFIDDVWTGNPLYPVHVTIFDGNKVSNGISFSSWGFSGDGSLQIAEGEGSTDSTSAIVWETSNGDGWQGQQFKFDPQDMRYSWPTDTLNLNVKAPAGINALSLGFYDKDGNAVWYAVDSGKFGFDGEWKHLSIALKDFQLYWDKFDTSKVTEFRLENGYENQTIAERLLFDTIYTGATGGGLTSVKENGVDIVKTFELKQNYPNPFNPATTIEFQLAKTAQTTLAIFNIRGEKVAELVSEQLPAGRHTYHWNANDMPSGAYFYKLKAEGFSQTRKMLLIH